LFEPLSEQSSDRGFATTSSVREDRPQSGRRVGGAHIAKGDGDSCGGLCHIGLAGFVSDSLPKAKLIDQKKVVLYWTTSTDDLIKILTNE
jgi:hypothetical protein